MTKEKFKLTSDLVKIESEPEQTSISQKSFTKKNDLSKTVRLTINIDAKLKRDLQILAFNQRRNMTDIIDEVLTDFMNNKRSQNFD